MNELAFLRLNIRRSFSSLQTYNGRLEVQQQDQVANDFLIEIEEKTRSTREKRRKCRKMAY